MPKQTREAPKPKDNEPIATLPKDKGKENEVNLSTIHFPQRLVRNKLDKKFSKFRDHMKEISINIPFVDVIRDMPLWNNRS